ncbi:MAG: IS66 family insertion sequence element accessory protein TnpB [Crocinitomicaceae bacterium]|nr:IS66 family insertion sequence element accessory protein TnpB [Crocinitomicaceae bacterium]
MILSFSNRHRYFVYRSACDMRKGFDGLSGLVMNEFKLDPLSGDVFVFFSRTGNRVKLLRWEDDGFAIYSKRLEKGTYEMLRDKNGGVIEIKSEQMQFILSGIILSSVKKKVRYEHRFVDKTSVESGVPKAS